MSAVQQIRLLLWKNFTLKMRARWTLLQELLLPISCALLLTGLKSETGEFTPKFSPYHQGLSFHNPPLTKFKIPNLGFVPNSASVKKVMRNIDAIITKEQPYQTVATIGFSSVKKAKQHVLDGAMPITEWIVVFETNNSQLLQGSSLPKQITYVLHPVLKKHQNFHTETMLPDPLPSSLSCNEPNLRIILQYFVSEAITLTWTKEQNISSTNFTPFIKCMAFEQNGDELSSLFSGMLSKYVIASLFISVVVFTSTIVEEKELKLKETMMLMGLKKSTYWTSWFVTFQTQFFLIMCLFTVALCVTPKGSTEPVLSADPSIVFVFLLAYGVALITFCFLVSALVHSGTIATFVSGISYLGLAWPGDYEDDKWMNYLVSISFNSALKKGFNIFATSATAAGEVTGWNNVHLPPEGMENDLTLLECTMMLLFDSFLHLLLAWYLEQVYPGPYGVAKPILLCVENPDCFQKVFHKKRLEKDWPINPDHFEPPHGNAPVAGIEMINLRKEFGTKVSVHGISLKMYQDQITVLLGHNGAGKTVTMSMLTGFLSPTSGTAFINGYNIKIERNKARKSLGLCPQLNVLFNWLTVKEQLEFFCELKGYRGTERDEDVRKYAQDLGLHTKMKKYSCHLSGGWKRKLSVGIALVGGSKVVILDEPTAGMDPSNRRDTWNVLKKARMGRTILMSTHYMDEADLLGDRIAIMVAGRVRCCGSSMFLKRIYGCGYYLVVALLDGCDLTQLESLIREHSPGVRLDKLVRSEVTYLLPDEDIRGFHELFNALELHKDDLFITGFGISTTSMEEVFIRTNEEERGINTNKSSTSEESTHHNLKLSFKRSQSIISLQEVPHDESQVDEKVQRKIAGTKFNDDEAPEMKPHVIFHALRAHDGQPLPRKTGSKLFWSITWALIQKRVLYTKRKLFVTIVQLLIPAVLLIAVLQSITSAGGSTENTHAPVNSKTEPPKLVYNLEKFDSAQVFFLSHKGLPDEDRRFGSYYSAQFKNMKNVIFNALPESSGKENDFDNYVLAKSKELGGATFVKSMPIGMRVERSNASEVSGTAFYNPAPHHALEITMNYLLNAMAQYALNDNTYLIQSSIQPFHNTTEKEEKRKTEILETITQKITAMLIGFGAVFAFGFMGTVVLQFLIYERETGAKQIQMVSGADITHFWLSNFLFDYTVFLIGTVVILLLIVAFQIEAFAFNLVATALALILWGWVLMPFMYATHFLFISPNIGSVFLVVYSIVTGMISVFVVSISELLLELIMSARVRRFRDITEFLCQMFIPIFNISRCITYIVLNFSGNEYCKDGCSVLKPQCCKSNCTLCTNYTENYLSWERPGIGRYLLAMAVQGFAFVGIIILIDSGVLVRLWYHIRCTSKTRDYEVPTIFKDEDSDVAAERARINSKPKSHYTNYGPGVDQLSLVNVYKCYGTHVAVDHICLGIPHGECFGLLGQNGAGKSTIFKILTGDVLLTSGNAFVIGHDVVDNIKKVQHHVGYCPQFNGLIWELTGKETLEMFARIRGLTDELVYSATDNLMEAFMFDDQADVPCGIYSGGTKRKLNAAVAVLGAPPVILLDEPSWGMDPAARRHMWDVLMDLRNSGHTMVLTSHSMEETEALCTRLCTMVNGSFVCLGSAQQLKNKFSSGYTFIVRLRPAEDGRPSDPRPLKDYVTRAVAGCELFEEHQNYLHYQAPEKPGQLGKIFAVLEKAKRYLPIADYNVQQTTLEQVFLSFTREQVAPLEDVSQSIINRLIPCIRG